MRRTTIAAWMAALGFTAKAGAIAATLMASALWVIVVLVSIGASLIIGSMLVCATVLGNERDTGDVDQW